MNLPTIRQLRYLTAVVGAKHFGKAADECFVTQSTLSAGIQDLENLLGAPLLERTKRKVLVTDLGHEVAERAQHILSLTEELVDIANLKKNPLSGRLKIGVIPSISPFLLPKALPIIRQQLPQTEFVLIEEQSERLVKQLKEGQIDLAILAFPYNVGQLEHEIFASETFWVALPKDHPLTEENDIEVANLPIEELLLLAEGHCLREHALSACHLPKTHHRSSLQATSLYTLIEMVAGGLGITLLPEMAINSDMVASAEICLRPLKYDERPIRELGVTWRPSFRSSQAVELLSKHLSEALS